MAGLLPPDRVRGRNDALRRSETPLCCPHKRGSKAMGLTGWVLLGVVALLIFYVIALYNRLVRLRALAKEGFSGITVQLRRRADLIPNLVEAVKGYATHERETL